MREGGYHQRKEGGSATRKKRSSAGGRWFCSWKSGGSTVMGVPQREKGSCLPMECLVASTDGFNKKREKGLPVHVDTSATSRKTTLQPT